MRAVGEHLVVHEIPLAVREPPQVNGRFKRLQLRAVDQPCNHILRELNAQHFAAAEVFAAARQPAGVCGPGNRLHQLRAGPAVLSTDVGAVLIPQAVHFLASLGSKVSEHHVVAPGRIRARALLRLLANHRFPPAEWTRAAAAARSAPHRRGWRSTPRLRRRYLLPTPACS